MKNLLLFPLLILMLTGCVSGQNYPKEPEADNTELNFAINSDPNIVIIDVIHLIQMPWGEPGYRVFIQNWGSEEPFSAYVIDPLGKTLTIIPVEQKIKSGADGSVSFDVGYTYGELEPGMCMFVLGGSLVFTN